MNELNALQPSKIYLITSNIFVIISNNLDINQGATNEILGVTKLILLNKARQLQAIPYKFLNSELCITYILKPGSQLDLDLFKWLFNSGIEFKRTAAAKYRFLLLGAQVKELINQINARN